jgi:hypothetical protein
MKNNFGIDLSNLDEYWSRRPEIPPNSGTNIDNFVPCIPWQKECLHDIRFVYDYSLGTHEVLLSGSVGSAKSLFLAHLAVTHCLMFPGACCGVFRMSMPDIRDTIFLDIVNHLGCDELKEGSDYSIDKTRCQIHFRNGSSIITRSFSDKKYTKVRSLRLSMAIFEEWVEFRSGDERAFREVQKRVGRIPHVKEKLIIGATNPDDPSHWLHTYFQESTMETRHVYYSLTFDNPFLDKTYVEGIIKNSTERDVLRMIFGRWLPINEDMPYYGYNSDINLRRYSYEIDHNAPIWLCWDFNIGEGKPMSAAAFQCINGVYHIFAEWVVQGMRTLDSCEEIGDHGILEIPTQFYIAGDAAGNSRDTRGTKTDFDIILKFMENFRTRDNRSLRVEKKVPRANPMVRDRHNKLNALFRNGYGEVKLFVYETAKTVDKAFRLTKLKVGSTYQENDSDPWQHIGTAVGYGILQCEKLIKHEESLNSARKYLNASF